MATKTRMQNPVAGDEVVLSMYNYSSNNYADVYEIHQVDIYYLDPDEMSEENPDGRRLVQSIAGDEVIHTDTGQYEVRFVAEDPKYVIGNYLDVWTVTYMEGYDPATQEYPWRIYPKLFFSTPLPAVYDFRFQFRPNRIRQGSKRHLIVEILPNVPDIAELVNYYRNLTIVSPLKIYIEQACVPCMPQEQDLRIVVDGEDVTLRESCRAFYKLDTEEMDCGIYNVWFEMEFADNLYISDKEQLQIF